MSENEAKTIAKGFLNYLKDKKKLQLLPQIVKFLKGEGIASGQVALVKTASPLSQSQKKEITTLLTSEFGTTELSFETDTSLIGGLKVIIGDQILDLSTREKLNLLTSDL